MATLTDIGLDTSVVMRLLTGQPEAQTERAVAALTAARRKGCRVVASDLVVAEAYFALQAGYDVPKMEALRALAAMFDSGDVEPEPDGCAPTILRECLGAGSKPGFVDKLIHSRYLQQGCALMSFEKAAKKLPKTQILPS